MKSIPPTRSKRTNMATSTPRKSKRYLAAAGLLAGGVTLGAMFSPVGLAGAAEDDTESTSADAETSTDAGTSTKGDRATRGERGEKREAVAELLGMEPLAVHEARHEGQTLAEIAADQGLSEDELTSGLAEIFPNVDEARITQMINSEGRGHGGIRHRLSHGAGREVVTEVTETLGISQEEIEAGLAEDKTLAEIAAEQGVSEDALVDALVAAVNENIDQAVAEEKIDADRAEKAKTKTEERMTNLVNRDLGERPEGGRRGPGGHRHGHGAKGADGAESADSADSDGGDTESS